MPLVLFGQDLKVFPKACPFAQGPFPNPITVCTVSQLALLYLFAQEQGRCTKPQHAQYQGALKRNIACAGTVLLMSTGVVSIENGQSMVDKEYPLSRKRQQNEDIKYDLQQHTLFPYERQAYQASENVEPPAKRVVMEGYCSAYYISRRAVVDGFRMTATAASAAAATF